MKLFEVAFYYHNKVPTQVRFMLTSDRPAGTGIGPGLLKFCRDSHQTGNGPDFV